MLPASLVENYILRSYKEERGIAFLNNSDEESISVTFSHVFILKLK